MFIQQIYTSCLAQASYYLESNGEAVIVDPIRDVDGYIQLARSRNATIKYVLETHFHADFVSGHLELAEKTGAIIVYGPGAKPAYPALVARSGEKIYLGDVMIETLHTPGHTVESCCFLVIGNDKPVAVFTGDTLFVGDVGRPDLMSGNLSKEELASRLYDSLHKHILTLPDDVIVYPGHGAGSPCGKNLGKETYSTIGEQKKLNYALQPMTREEFITAVTKDQPVPPAYFFKDAKINIEGYKSLDTILQRELTALNADQFAEEMRKGAVVLDTRSVAHFGSEFIKGAINIGLEGDFAIWAGTLIDFNKPLLIVAEKGKEKEAIVRLARVGYENIKGYLEGGISSWILARKPMDDVRTLTFSELAKEFSEDEYVLLDVRRPGEVANGKLSNALTIQLAELPKSLEKLDASKRYAIYCAGGYRSMIAASVMKANGFGKVLNLRGGFKQIAADHPEQLEACLL